MPERRHTRTDRTFYLDKNINFVDWGDYHGGDGIYAYTTDKDGEINGKIILHHLSDSVWRTLANDILRTLNEKDTCPTCGQERGETDEHE